MFCSSAFCYFWENSTCVEWGVGLGGNVQSAKVSGNSFLLKHLQTLCELFERMGLHECNEHSLTPCFLLLRASESTSGMHRVRESSVSSPLAGGESESTFPHDSSEDIPGCISSLVIDGHSIDGTNYYHNAWPVRNQRMEELSRPAT